MSKTEIVINYLSYYFTENHPFTFLYVFGLDEDKKNVVDKITNDISYFFTYLDNETLNGLVKSYLENKLTEYKNGLLEVDFM